jgi:zinc transport system substrate-binding protein
VLAASAGCAKTPHTDVIASFYPLAYAAERVAGPDLTIRNLTSPGVEPHDLELSPRQVDEVKDARLVVVLGKDFQPAVEKAAKSNHGTVAVLTKLPIPQSDVVKEGDDNSFDPHVWLDPVLMADVADRVTNALARAFPSRAATFRARAVSLKSDLVALDARYRAGLAGCARKEIVTSHAAFGRLAGRYGLTQRSIAGFSPETEPDPARLADVSDLIKRDGVTTVFTEELVSQKVAQTLARETGARTEVLSPIEGLTKSEAKAGATYLTLMDSNLAKLRAALGCT